MANVEPSPPEVLKGYNLVANVMGQHPDFAIYRRFMAAHHFDLMLQQAEILYLLHELGRIKRTDIRSSNENFRDFDTHFRKLIESSENADEYSQWAKSMELRSKLKEHGDHMLQLHSLLNLPSVNKKDVNTFRTWLKQSRGAADFLTDWEDHLWSAETEDDLTSLKSRDTEHDTLSRFIKGKVLSWLHLHWLHKVKSNFVPIRDPFFQTSINTALDVYSDRAIDHIVAVLSTTMSSLLPTMSIFVLYFVHNQLVRLGLILIFTVLFSIMVMVLTNAKRSECFAAAAAFSAIQVVFVSGSSPSSSSA